MVLLATAAAGATAVITTWLGSHGRKNLSAQINPTPANSNVPEVTATVPAEQILITRQEWGAMNPAVSESGPGEYGPYHPVANPSGWLIYDQPLKDILNRIIIHHSALPLSDGPREIQRLHMEEKGFADVGYHFLIDQAGLLYEGRSMMVRGAHAYGANYASVGICLIGNFEEIQPTLEQMSTLQALLTSLASQYTGIVEIAGHRDLNSETLCPGANLYPLLPELAMQHSLQYRY